MKADRIDLGLTGYDELFMSTEERLDAKKPKVDELPLNELKPFKDHPFKVMEDEEMERLKESIRVSGVLIPALARPTESGYELISGHRRLAACRALGLSTMPVIVRNLTDEEAIITMVDSNLQREHILPSEKAFAYKMKMDALSRQGKRTDLTSTQPVSKLRSNEIVGASGGESREQVRRYIRLTNLIPDILKLVDEGRIALTPAVELSYLNSHEQNALYQIMDCDEVTPSLSTNQLCWTAGGDPESLKEMQQVIADKLISFLQISFPPFSVILTSRCPSCPSFRPVTSTLTFACFLFTSGKTLICLIWKGSLAVRHIFPTIPFQLVWVYSVTACDQKSIGYFITLLTHKVMVWIPGVRDFVRSKWSGVESLSSEPQNSPSTYTSVSQWHLSRSIVMTLPSQESGMTTSRWYHARP